MNTNDSVTHRLRPEELDLLDQFAQTAFASLVREMWQRQDGDEDLEATTPLTSYASVGDHSYLAAWHLLQARRRFRMSTPPGAV